MNNGELDQIANMAKEKLKKQAQGNEVVDVYASVRNSDVNSDINEVSESMRIQTKLTEDDNQEEFEIKSTPTNSYFEQEFPEVLPNDSFLFEGGPTKTMVDSFKKQWEGYPVMVVNIAERFFVFRTLNRFEYKQIVALQNVDPLQREEIICEQVTLWPQSYNWKGMAADLAGIPSTYSQVIMEKSGFSNDYAVEVI